jgi:hypothetical protein
MRRLEEVVEDMITGEGCTVKCTMQRREGVGVAVSVKLGCGERERGRVR